MTSYDLTVGMLGPRAAAVKSSLLKVGRGAEWNRIVRNAHKQGYAVDSFLDPNIPQPLKQRTPGYLQQQASSMVNSAYAPAQKELTQRETQIKALDDKRALDNQYYNNWLNTQHQALMAGAQTADAALTNAATTIQASTGAAYDQAKRGAIQQLAQLPGTVSNFNNANALGEVDAHKATGVGQVGAQGQQALAGIDTAHGMEALAGANNFATIAALESKRTSDTWAANNALQDDRFKLDSAEAQDFSKVLTDSINREITKAQSNRDYGAVVQKLGLQQQNQLSEAQSRRSSARHQAASLAETISYHKQLTAAKQDAQDNSSANAEANFEAKWGVSRQTFTGWTDTQRQQYLQRARDRGIIPGGKTGAAAFTPTQLRASQQDYRSALSWAQGHKPAPGEMNALVQALQAPKSGGETQHDPATGKIVYNADGTPKRVGGGGFGLKDPLLAKAVALVAIYGGVDAKTQQRVKDQYGITLPTSKKVSFPTKSPKLYSSVG